MSVDEIRARLRAASPGPWSATTSPMEHGGWPVLEMGDYVIFCAPCVASDTGTKEADAALISNAPADLEYLLAAHKRVWAVNVERNRVIVALRVKLDRVRDLLQVVETAHEANARAGADAFRQGNDIEAAGCKARSEAFREVGTLVRELLEDKP